MSDESGTAASQNATEADEEDELLQALAFDERPKTLADVDMAAVSAVIRRVELSTIRLQHSHTEISRLELPSDWHSDAFVLWRTSLAYREEDQFISEVSFLIRYYDGISAKEAKTPPSGDEGSDFQLEIECDYELFYKLEEQDLISNRALQHFSFFNAPQNAWGYAREYIHSITGRMGVEALVLPVLRIPALRVSRPPDEPTAET